MSLSSICPRFPRNVAGYKLAGYRRENVIGDKFMKLDDRDERNLWSEKRSEERREMVCNENNRSNVETEPLARILEIN